MPPQRSPDRPVGAMQPGDHVPRFAAHKDRQREKHACADPSRDHHCDQVQYRDPPLAEHLAQTRANDLVAPSGGRCSASITQEVLARPVLPAVLRPGGRMRGRGRGRRIDLLTRGALVASLLCSTGFPSTRQSDRAAPQKYFCPSHFSCRRPGGTAQKCLRRSRFCNCGSSPPTTVPMQSGLRVM